MNKKPTAHLELVGAFKKDPQRKRDSEPVCKAPVGKAPKRLTKDQREAWNYLVDSAKDVPGVLTRLDRAFLELCAIGLAGVWTYDPANNNSRPLSANALSTVGNMLSKLGMTPVDRSNVVVPKAENKDEYGDFTPA